MINKNTNCALFTASLLIFWSVFLYQCTQNENGEVKTEETKTKKISLKPSSIDSTKYPNEDSELAWLMRQMYEDGEKMKSAVQNKQFPEDFREKFKQMHTAVPTDASVKNEVFKASAQTFLRAMDKFYVEKDKQVENFNLLVNACVACHQNYCPGPIKKIKKLTID